MTQQVNTTQYFIMVDKDGKLLHQIDLGGEFEYYLVKLLKDSLGNVCIFIECMEQQLLILLDQRGNEILRKKDIGLISCPCVFHNGRYLYGMGIGKGHNLVRFDIMDGKSETISKIGMESEVEGIFVDGYLYFCERKERDLGTALLCVDESNQIVWKLLLKSYVDQLAVKGEFLYFDTGHSIRIYRMLYRADRK